MAKFTVTLGASVQAYCTVEFEADNEIAARAKAAEMVTKLNSGDESAWPKEVGVFNPDYSTIGEFRSLDDLIEEE